MEESAFLPYITKMQRQSGAYTILLAFHSSGKDSMSKDEICNLAQPYCKDEMDANYMGGRPYGAWEANNTLAKHGLVTVHKAGVSYTERGF